MKTVSECEVAAKPMLHHWNALASSARKPIECTFGIFKGRFVFKDGIRMQHEDDIVFFKMTCTKLHTLYINENACLVDHTSDDNLVGDDKIIGDEDEVTNKRNIAKNREMHFFIMQLRLVAHDYAYCTTRCSQFGD